MSHATLQELTESVHGLSPAPEHLATCAACRDTEARLRDELELLRRADARLVPPSSRRRLGGTIPLALAASVLLAVTALVVFRSGPDGAPGSKGLQDRFDVKKTIDVFLGGKEEESREARRALVERAPEVLGALVDARLRRRESIRQDALAELIFELKEKRADESGKAILETLKKIIITVDMQNAPLTAVMDYIRDISGLNISADPALKPEKLLISFKVNDIPLNRALDLLGFVTPLEYDARYGTLLIGAAERLFEMPKASPPLPLVGQFRRQELNEAGKATLKKMDAMKIDLSFEDSRVSDIVAFIRDFSGMNILLQPGLADDPITLKTKNLNLSSVLELITLPRDLDVRIEQGALLLFNPKK